MYSVKMRSERGPWGPFTASVWGSPLSLRGGGADSKRNNCVGQIRQSPCDKPYINRREMQPETMSAVFAVVQMQARLSGDGVRTRAKMASQIQCVLTQKRSSGVLELTFIVS